MRSCGVQATGRPREAAVGFGLWRAAAAAPAMLCSLLLVVVATRGLGPWTAPIVLVWVACGAVGLTRAGERVAVRAAFGFRRPSPAHAAALQPLWAAALQLSATPVGEVNLYVQRSRQPNAYAAGGRSVAVTSRALEDYRDGRLAAEQMVAVLVHELGHHATRATQPMLVAMWLAAPWRMAARLLTGLAGVLSGHPSQRAVRTVVMSGITVAVVRAVQQGQWVVGGVLGALVLLAVICPLADAAVCRRAEFAADRFAADQGLGLELASALRALNDGSSTALGSSRWLASHPTSGRRIRAILTAAPLGLQGAESAARRRLGRPAQWMATVSSVDHHFDHHLASFATVRGGPWWYGQVADLRKRTSVN